MNLRITFALAALALLGASPNEAEAPIGCYHCDHWISWWSGEYRHNFPLFGPEVVYKPAERHGYTWSYPCNVHHMFCPYYGGGSPPPQDPHEELQFGDNPLELSESFERDPVGVLAALVQARDTRILVNWDRDAVQILDCTGSVFAQYPLGEELEQAVLDQQED